MRKGRVVSAETRRKMSESSKQFWAANPEKRQQTAEKVKEQWASGSRKEVECKKRVTRVCLNCSKSVETYNYDLQFCSHSCYRELQHQKLDEQGFTLGRLCPVCGVEIDNRFSQTCSVSCGRTHTYLNGEYRETSIEKIVREFFVRQRIAFRAQVPVGPFIADFLLSDKTVVECDGDYWHSLPEMIRRDRRKDYYLKKSGLTVIRLSETSIRSGEWVVCLEGR